jgi:hypothetical protein
MEMAKTKVSYQDVIDFFEDSDLDLANLTHQLATAKLNNRIEKKQEIGERLTKARKARKPRGEAAEGQADATLTPATQAASA